MDLSDSVERFVDFKGLANSHPSPIMVVNSDSSLNYANLAANELFQTWYTNGNQVPDLVKDEVSSCLSKKEPSTAIFSSLGKTYELMITPYPELGRVALYAKDLSRELELESKIGDLESKVYKNTCVREVEKGLLHDVNGILTAGYMSLETMKLDFENGVFEDIPYTASLMLESLDRVKLLSDSLWDLWKDRSPEYGWVDFNEIVRDSVKLAKFAIPKTVDVKETYAEDLSMIYSNKGLVGQVVMNLLFNAKDFLPEKGVVSIKTSAFSCDNRCDSTNNIQADCGFACRDGILGSGKYAVLSVSDNGCGIENSVLSKIFSPDFTTRKKNGRGIGLSVVDRIIKENNGRVDVISKTGEHSGTTFSVFLPQYEFDASKK